MKILPFTALKAPLVLALKVGEEFQTRRMINPQFKRLLAMFPDGSIETERIFRKGDQRIRPRYRPGDVCAVGVPHRRYCERVWDEWTGIARFHHDIPANYGRDWVPPGRRMAGRYMPAWAATAWVRILSAEPQRLQDCTEADAVAELVERGPIGCGWRDYLVSDVGAFPSAVLYDCRTAVESYETLINATHGRDVWAENPWDWRIVAQRIEKHQEAEL